MRKGRKIDFSNIAAEALGHAETILCRWLPDGRREGREWVAKTPTHADRKPGSFKINLRTGKWSDFSTGDRGGDLISLAAYLHGLDQAEAARRLAEMLGIRPHV